MMKNEAYGIAGGPELLFDSLDGKGPLKVERLAPELARKAIDFFYRAKPIERFGFRPDKPINALLSPQASGVLIHEALGHHLERDIEEMEGAAILFGDLVGKQVTTPKFTLKFNPRLSLGRGEYLPFGYYFYDWEGTRGREVTAIQRGVVKEMLNDLVMARVYGTDPNGHAREDYIRMSNLQIMGAEEEKSELFERIAGKGFYIRSVYGGVTSGESRQFETYINDLYWVERPDRLIPIAIYAPSSSRLRDRASIEFALRAHSIDVLSGIKAIGRPDKHELYGSGYCGKEWQWVPVSEGGHYLLVERLPLTKNEYSVEERDFVPVY
jgi:predicted Zn-dependent protease